MEEIKRGGKREGAGRKPLDNPKKLVSLYIEKTKIFAMGGEEKLKKRIYDFIVSETKVPESDFKPIIGVLTSEAAESVTFRESRQDESKNEVKSQFTGLSSKLSDFDKFSAELRAAKSRQQVEAIMRQSNGGIMFPKERITLKSVADEVLLDMFND